MTTHTAETSRPIIDVSKLPSSAMDSRSPIWWGNALLLCIETSMFMIVIASYFYFRRNFAQWPPPKIDQLPVLYHPVPKLLWATIDLVLMLAVIHHLLLMEQIPLPAIIALCHRLTRRHLVIEWVPVEDPMYQSLMRGRDSLYGALSQTDLLNACEGRFRLMKWLALDNGRILLLFEKIAA